jgi:hypothetical protein
MPVAPSGATLRALGIDRPAQPSKGAGVPSMQNCARASSFETYEENKCCSRKTVLTREALI